MATRIVAAAREPATGRRALRLVLAGDVLAFLVFAPRVMPFAVAAWALLEATAGRRAVFAKVGRDVAAPVAAGLTLLALALLVLNSVDGLVRPDQVHAIQERLAEARLATDEWTDPTVPRVLALAVALLACSALVTTFDLTERVKQARGALGFAQTLLLTLTTFTISAQAPLQAALDRTHERHRSEYEAALRQEWRAEARAAAARSLRPATERLLRTARKAPRFEAFLKGVDRASTATLRLPAARGAPAGDRTLKVVDPSTAGAIELRIFPRTAAGAARRDPAAAARDQAGRRLATPRSRADLRAEAIAVRAQETAAARETSRAARITRAALVSATQAVEVAVPVHGALLHALFGAFLDRLAESGESAVVARVVGASGRPPPAEVAPSVATVERLLLPPSARWKPAIAALRDRPLPVALDRGFVRLPEPPARVDVFDPFRELR